MLYALPLEPLEERYTEQWYRWFRRDCDRLGVPYEYIDGVQLGDEVEVGTVLDAAGTCHWKMIQMARVCKLFKSRAIHDGDIFFSMDMWHPGLECIPYMATLYGADIKVYAFLHAGSYTHEDFAAPMASWATKFERGWFALCDKVFVGSEYHKNKFVDKRLMSTESCKIVVSGNPITISEMPEINLEPRENIIIYTHRWDVEKRPGRFVRAMSFLWEYRQDFRVVITTSRRTFRSNSLALLAILDDVEFPYEVKVGLSKWEYYQELNKAKVFVSTTIEENFGYCLVEAMAMGVTPVVSKGFSHIEIMGLLGYTCIHQDTVFADVCIAALDRPNFPLALRGTVSRYENSFVKMIEVMCNA